MITLYPSCVMSNAITNGSASHGPYIVACYNRVYVITMFYGVMGESSNLCLDALKSKVWLFISQSTLVTSAEQPANYRFTHDIDLAQIGSREITTDGYKQGRRRGEEADEEMRLLRKRPAVWR